MRKKLLLLVTGLLLTGCHGHMVSSEEETTEVETTVAELESETGESQENVKKDTLPEFNENKKINITFWAKNDTNKSQVDIYNKAISDFEKLYPNIKVTIKTYTDYGTIYNDVITNIATNTTPNVCITYPDHIATYLTGKDVVVPLDDYINDSRYGLGGSQVKYDSVSKEEVVERFLSEGIINGKQYAIPFMRSTEACYINKTYVEKLGYEVPDVLTWDYIWEVSEAAMKKDASGNFEVNGQKVLIPFIYKSTDNMMISMFWQQGVQLSDDSGNIYLFTDTARNIMKTVYEHGGTRAFSTFKISSYPANFLNAGQCIFAIDSTAGSTWMGSKAPLVDIAPDKIVDFKTVVRPIPQYDTENIQMISQGPSICVFNKKDSDEVTASWLFAQFLMTNDVQIAYSKTEGYLPVTLKAQNSDVYKAYIAAEGTDDKEHYAVKIQAAKLLMDNIDNTFVTSVFNGSASLRDAAGQLIEDAVKAARRSQKMGDKEIDTEFKNTISLFKLDSKKVKNTASEIKPSEPENNVSETDEVGETVEIHETENTEPETTEEETDYKNLGKLPSMAIGLIASLIVVWGFIIAYITARVVKNKKE